MSPASDASVRLQRTWLVLIGVSLALALFGAVLVQWRQVELLDDAVHGQTDALGYRVAKPSAQEAPREQKQEPGRPRICEDSGDLDQASGDVDAHQGLEGVPDEAERPQHVHVPRRIIAEETGSIECAGTNAGHLLGPGVEVTDVDAEAALWHPECGDERSKEQPTNDDREQESPRAEGQAALE